jgi:two-component system, OmpR family, phosphate regulon response regulator PhoB
MRRRVLIVEDEPDVARLLEFHLRSAGFDVDTVATVRDAHARIVADAPMVVVLDVMLPDGNGFDLCHGWRSQPETRDLGVLMLTARADADDRITGLEVGADDYVSKPFIVREVVLRVTALANRMAERASPVATAAVVQLGPLTIDARTHEVTLAGELLALRPLEYKLLMTLAAAPGRVFSRDELLGCVWDIHGSVTTRTVDVHVRRLRQSLGAGAEWVETVHGFGYRAKKFDAGPG